MAVLTLGPTTDPRPMSARVARTDLPRALGGAVSWMVARWRLRHDIRFVEGFTDAMLQDIGLSRGGIDDAVRHGRGPRDLPFVR